MKPNRRIGLDTAQGLIATYRRANDDNRPYLEGVIHQRERL